MVFCLAASPDAPERTLITLDFKRKVLSGRYHNLQPGSARARVGQGMPAARGENLELEVFLDGSILEVFVNKRVTLTTRLYPTQMDDLHLYGYTSLRELTIKDFQMWEMDSCY